MRGACSSGGTALVAALLRGISCTLPVIETEIHILYWDVAMLTNLMLILNRLDPSGLKNEKTDVINISVPTDGSRFRSTKRKNARLAKSEF